MLVILYKSGANFASYSRPNYRLRSDTRVDVTEAGCESQHDQMTWKGTEANYRVVPG